MATGDLLIRNPWNIDVELKKSQGDDISKAFNIIAPSTPNTNVDGNGNVAQGDVYKKIFQDAFKTPVKSDPFASKFQDASLSDRYEGRSVFYQDYLQDPSKLDARYAHTQSWGETAYNNLKVGLANGASMFAIGTLALPEIIKNIASGRSLSDSDLTKSMFEWNRSVADNNINFQNEQDQKKDVWNTIANTLLPSFVTGSTTGWGSIFENMMYGVGAGASAYLTGGLTSMALRGVSGSALLSTQVAKTLNNLDSIRKYGTIAERIIDSSKALRNTAVALNNSYKLADAAKWSYRGMIGSFGEAGFEGEEARHSTRTLLTQRFKEMNGYDPMGDDLVKINKLADEAASARFWSNMGLLMATNTYQMGRLFKNMDIAKDEVKRLAEQGLRVGMNESGEIIAKKSFELTGNWWNTSKLGKRLKSPIETIGAKVPTDFIGESVSEGLEEFSQNWIDKSVNSYYTWKLDHRGQPSIDQAIKSIRDGFSESWNVEGLQAFLSGAVAGVGQQAIFSLPNISKQAELSKQSKEALESVISEYNEGFDVNDFFKASNVDSLRGTVGDRASNLNAEGVIDKVEDIATKNEDSKIYKDVQSLSFFGMASPYIKRGHADILKQQYAYSLESMSEEAFQELNNNPNITPKEAIEIFNQQVDDMNRSFSRIKQAFRNPYSANRNEYKMFEDEFIPELSYLDYRGGELNKRLSEIQDTLGDYYSEFKYFADASKLNTGKQYIREQIETYSNNQEYFKKIKMVGGNEEFNKSKYLIKIYNESLQKLEEFENDSTYDKYNEFLDTYFEGFISKLERDEKGFFRKEEVMNKLSDFNRIVGDVDTIEQLLKTYMSPNGDQFFYNNFRIAANREQRKRDLYNINQGLINKRPDLIKQFPTLSEEEIDEVLLNSTNSKQVESKLSKLTSQKEKNNTLISQIQDEIREVFVKEAHSEDVEDYLNNTIISPKEKKEAIKSAKEYISTLKNEEYRKHKDAQDVKLKEDLNKISPDLIGNQVEDAGVYQTLSRDDKVKYHESMIRYHKGLKDFKNLPTPFVKKQNELIKGQEDIINSLPKEQKKFSEQVGDYLIVEDNKGKYNVSYKNKYAQSFDSERAAKDYIKEQEDAKNVKTDVSANNQISHVENKFENGYYNPQRFDENGNIITENLDNNLWLRNEMVRSWEGMSEEQINDKIKENLILTRYTTEGINGTAKIYSSNDENSGNLPQELILRGLTADAVVLSYNYADTPVPFNTFKHPKKAFGFMNDEFIRKTLSNKFSKEEVEDVIKFVSGNTYFEFLNKSLNNRKVYNLLTNKGVLRFKGSVEEQISLIEQKQQIFDRLMNDDDIKNDFDFNRIFTSINNDRKGEHSILDIENPFAQLKGDDGKLYNKYVFFRVPNDFEVGGDPKVEFTGLETNFQKDAKDKITRYYQNGNNRISSGYYMLLTDSVGNPIVYSLKNKNLTPEEVYSRISETSSFEGVYILSSNPNYNFTVSQRPEGYRINIGDVSDGSLLTIQYKIESLKDVEDLIPELYKQLNKPQNWIVKDGGEKVNKSIDTNELGISFVVNTKGKPSNIEDIINSRNISGINPHNFLVNKINLSPKQIGNTIKGLPEQKKEIVEKEITELPVANDTIPTNVPNINSRELAKRTPGLNIPPTITYEQVDELIGKMSNLQSTPDQLALAIILGSQVREAMKKVPVYLNDIEDIKVDVLDKIAQLGLIPINNTFRQQDFANLVSTKIPYKTNIVNVDTENQIEKLLKNCFR